jgi:hypothetical protein
VSNEFNPDELLVELRKTLSESGGKRKAALAESVSAIWDYLVKTPGEQRPYDEFSRMLNVSRSGAFGKLKTLVKNGIVKKTAGRMGGNGVGFICEWLEARRRGETTALVIPTEIRPRHEAPHDIRCELTDIDSLAERGVQSMRTLNGRDRKLGLAMVETLREIQARVSRAMIGLTTDEDEQS